MTHNDDLDVAYANLHAAMAGMLPADRHAVTKLNRRIRKSARAASKDQKRHKSVRDFEKMLTEDGVLRMLVAQMINEVPQDHKTVNDIDDLLLQLDHIITWPPAWELNEAKRNFFPMSALFTYMMMTQSGLAVFRMPAMNDALRPILREWCRYLDHPHSAKVVNDGPDGWLSPAAYQYNKLWEFEAPDKNAPHWGWTCFNDFFHREIKPRERPVAGSEDDSVVVSPNDGTVYKVTREVDLEAKFWIKSQPYSVRDMLAGNALTEKFAGGDVVQSYLSGADYHRWHAPVSGHILSTEIVEGLMFSNLVSEGNDIKGTGSQGFYTSVNTRGLCFIKADNKALGIVCVMPVGITEISSIRHTVSAKQHVTKGEELGRFSYGGSSLATLFVPGAIDHFTIPNPPKPSEAWKIKVNSQIAVAKTAK